MSTAGIIAQLRCAAQILKPFTSNGQSGGLQWDGTEYRPNPSAPFDPYALSWWGILSTAADLIEAQEHPLTVSQRRYLEQVLLGGMGSFNDFVLDVHSLGDAARQANSLLDEVRQELHRKLDSM